MVEQEVKNIEVLEKEEEEKAAKASLFRIIAGSPKNALSFNTLD